MCRDILRDELSKVDSSTEERQFCTEDRKFGDEGPNFVDLYETKQGAVYELLCEVLQSVKNKTLFTSNIDDNVVRVGLGKNPI